MSRSPLRSPTLLRMILVLGFTVTACGERPSERSAATAPPSAREPVIDDPRIGEGLPAEVRFAGVEHNRLTMVLLRQTRDPAQRRLAARSPCETVVAGLVAESPRTAALASIPERADLLAAIMRGVLAAQPACNGRIVPPSITAILGDAGVTADTHPDSMLTDASFAIIDEMLERIRVAASTADVQAALESAAAAAVTLGAADALAVQAAVAQSQGSFVLWGPNGAGWTELGLPSPMQSVFRVGEREVDTIGAITGLIVSDGAGCRGALSFLRVLPIVQDSRLLLGACGIAAAATTVTATYALFNQY
jgi:hypothetical protein